jgi:hypothetical protein
VGNLKRMQEQLKRHAEADQRNEPHEVSASNLDALLCGDDISDLVSAGGLPIAHNGCQCQCHKVDGITHFSACCWPE